MYPNRVTEAVKIIQSNKYFYIQNYILLIENYTFDKNIN